MKSTDHPEKGRPIIKQENNGDSSISDVEVIRECIEEKNQNSCNEFMRRYFEKVSRLVRRITKNQLDTQDVVQDVFLKVIEKIDTYRGLSKFSTWVYKITENTSFNYLRANTKYNKSLSFEDNMFFNTDEYNFTTMSIIPTASTDAIADHHEKDYDEGDEATEGESGAEAEGAMPGAEEAQDGMEDAAPAP